MGRKGKLPTGVQNHDSARNTSISDWKIDSLDIVIDLRTLMMVDNPQVPENRVAARHAGKLYQREKPSYLNDARPVPFVLVISLCKIENR
jgi:hypothetical protein